MAVGTVTVLVLTFRARFFFFFFVYISIQINVRLRFPHGDYKSRRTTVFLLFPPFALIPDVSTCFLPLIIYRPN